MMFRPLPVLTLFTAIGLVILILLGNWQWDRYSEKMARASAGPLEWERAEIDVGERSTIALRTVMFGKAGLEDHRTYRQHRRRSTLRCHRVA